MSKTAIESQRDYLDDILRSIEGVNKVYYQPPASVHLEYPCILYKLSGYNRLYANDVCYASWPEYEVTLIDYDPESILQKKILDLRKDADSNCYVHFDRFFTSDNLNHWTYRLTFTKASW